MAAEKLRDGEWWERTLQPLRERERAATLAAAGAAAEGAAAEGGSSPPQPTGIRAAVVEARRQKLAAAADKQAAALLVEREDAELAERAQLVRLALPKQRVQRLEMLQAVLSCRPARTCMICVVICLRHCPPSCPRSGAPFPPHWTASAATKSAAQTRGLASVSQRSAGCRPWLVSRLGVCKHARRQSLAEAAVCSAVCCCLTQASLP